MFTRQTTTLPGNTADSLPHSATAVMQTSGEAAPKGRLSQKVLWQEDRGTTAPVKLPAPRGAYVAGGRAMNYRSPRDQRRVSWICSTSMLAASSLRPVAV